MFCDSSHRHEKLSYTEGSEVMSIPLCKSRAQPPFPATRKGAVWEAQSWHMGRPWSLLACQEARLGIPILGVPIQSWAMGAGQGHPRPAPHTQSSSCSSALGSPTFQPPRCKSHFLVLLPHSQTVPGSFIITSQLSLGYLILTAPNKLVIFLKGDTL